MSNTRQQIINLADRLIREKGYNAFSYKDISSALNVKNAAIHYHFPSKAELGKAVIQRTSDDFGEKTNRWESLPPQEKLESFIHIYEESQAKNLVCFMGALGPAYETFPEIMQETLTSISQELRFWLRKVLEEGLASGDFQFHETVEQKADLIISSLLSGLILQRVTKENILINIKAAILSGILVGS